MRQVALDQRVRELPLLPRELDTVPLEPSAAGAEFAEPMAAIVKCDHVVCGTRKSSKRNMIGVDVGAIKFAMVDFDSAAGIEIDSAYTPALAGLAMVHATLHEWFGGRQEDLAAADRAPGEQATAGPGVLGRAV